MTTASLVLLMGLILGACTGKDNEPVAKREPQTATSPTEAEAMDSLADVYGSPSPLPKRKAKPKPKPLSLDQIKLVDPGIVTLDIIKYPNSSHALFVEGVNDAPLGGTVAGLYAPLGLTDKNLILYGLASCKRDLAPLPRRWEPVPGESRSDMLRFARVARRMADKHFC